METLFKHFDFFGKDRNAYLYRNSQTKFGFFLSALFIFLTSIIFIIRLSLIMNFDNPFVLSEKVLNYKNITLFQSLFNFKIQISGNSNNNFHEIFEIHAYYDKNNTIEKTNITLCGNDSNYYCLNDPIILTKSKNYFQNIIITISISHGAKKLNLSDLLGSSFINYSFLDNQYFIRNYQNDNFIMPFRRNIVSDIITLEDTLQNNIVRNSEMNIKFIDFYSDNGLLFSNEINKAFFYMESKTKSFKKGFDKNTVFQLVIQIKNDDYYDKFILTYPKLDSVITHLISFTFPIYLIFLKINTIYNENVQILNFIENYGKKFLKFNMKSETFKVLLENNLAKKSIFNNKQTKVNLLRNNSKLQSNMYGENDERVNLPRSNSRGKINQSIIKSNRKSTFSIENNLPAYNSKLLLNAQKADMVLKKLNSHSSMVSINSNSNLGSSHRNSQSNLKFLRKTEKISSLTGPSLEKQSDYPEYGKKKSSELFLKNQYDNVLNLGHDDIKKFLICANYYKKKLGDLSLFKFICWCPCNKSSEMKDKMLFMDNFLSNFEKTVDYSSLFKTVIEHKVLILTLFKDSQHHFFKNMCKMILFKKNKSENVFSEFGNEPKENSLFLNYIDFVNGTSLNKDFYDVKISNMFKDLKTMILKVKKGEFVKELEDCEVDYILDEVRRINF